jgi:NADH dehydrogenase (ubiquinone) 1 alpha subcomplex subunit 8
MLCKTELSDPRKCVNEGKAVTGCTLEFFRKMKKFCHEEIEQYANCLDMSSTKLEFKKYGYSALIFLNK